MRVTKTSITGAALLTVLAAGAAASAAFAQAASEDPTETQTEDRFEGRHAGAQTDFAAGLAEELGLGVDRVTEALETVQAERAAERDAEQLAELTERLDAAVDEGSLTRAQADAILEAREAGVIGDFGGRGHRGGFGPGRPRGDGSGLPPPGSQNSGPEAPQSDTDA